MFYKALETADGDTASAFVAAETFWSIVIWCLIEAFLIEGIYRWLVVSISKTHILFHSLGMDMTSAVLSWLSTPVYWFGFLGSGNLWDWAWRGFVLWMCTGIPMILLRVHRR